MLVVGVDGCSGGWVLVALEDGAFAGAARHNRFSDVMSAASDATAIGVDIPIGLLAKGHRACDGLAMTLVGPRRASVFRTPPRAAIEADDYARANELSRGLTGKGLSKQAYSLRDKILEVDDILRKDRHQKRRGAITHQAVNHHADTQFKRHRAAMLSNPEEESGASDPRLAGGRVIEVHPEASFREMAGSPLPYPKRAYNGAMHRLDLLRLTGIELPHPIESLGDAGFDDVVDAAAVAWTAHRYALGKAMSLPPASGWQRDGSRVIAIWI